MGAKMFLYAVNLKSKCPYYKLDKQEFVLKDIGIQYIQKLLQRSSENFQLMISLSL